MNKRWSRPMPTCGRVRVPVIGTPSVCFSTGHARVIYNYCFRRIGNWATAEDLLSVVFLEAWRRRDKELPPDKVLPWLFGIATNVVLNRQRSERRYLGALARMPFRTSQISFKTLNDNSMIRSGPSGR
jgi:DNA-directed RNA polymerase specialized sigma24 family protein